MITIIWFEWHFFVCLSVLVLNLTVRILCKKMIDRKTYRTTHTIFDYRLESTNTSTLFSYRSNSIFSYLFCNTFFNQVIFSYTFFFTTWYYKWKGNQLSFSLFSVSWEKYFARFSFIFYIKMVWSANYNQYSSTSIWW